MSQINYVETADFYVERDVMKAPLHEMHYHNGVEVYYLIKGERDYFIGVLWVAVRLLLYCQTLF